MNAYASKTINKTDSYMQSLWSGIYTDICAPQYMHEYIAADLRTLTGVTGMRVSPRALCFPHIYISL